MNRLNDWTAKARSFHNRRLSTYRKVMRLRKSRIVFTTGQATTTLAAFFVAGSAESADLPRWIFWTVLVGGILGGRYVFPIPVSSIASRRGPDEVFPKSAAELDTMTPEGIKSFENNMVLKYRLKGPDGLGTTQALERQRQAAQAAEQVASVATGSLTALSLVDTQAFSAAAARHDLLRSRWLSYEVDPHLQFDFPAMSDPACPPTAAMIRAMHAAEEARSAGRADEYRSAVAGFDEALAAAEAAAGVPSRP